MRFECYVDINVPLEKAVALFNNPDNMKEWQDGFVSYEPISGTPRTVGAKAKITYNNRGRKIELLETIKVMNLPSEMTAKYEHEHMVNTLTNRFARLKGNMTRYTTFVGYVKPIGFMPKLMSKLFPGMFKKQNQKWLNQFKAFAEKQ